MQVKLNERITLTDESSESSYGVPVAVIGREVYGPRDVVGNGGHAGPVVQAVAIAARLQGTITTEQLEWCARFWK